MTRLRIFLFRLSALVRSRQMDREIDDEIAEPSGRSDRGVRAAGSFPGGEAPRPTAPNVAGVFLQGWDLSAMALASDAWPADPGLALQRMPRRY